MKDAEVKRRIRETREILMDSNSSDSRYFTILLNSLLSLIVLPTEQIKRQKFKKVFPDSFKSFSNTVGITPIIFEPLKKINDDGTVEKENKTVSNFIRKLRNSIAHQNIEFIDGVDETWISFYNVVTNDKSKVKKYNGACKKSKNRLIDFEIKVNAKQLKKLALYIAGKYLEGTADD